MRWFRIGRENDPDFGYIKMETITHVEAHQDDKGNSKGITTVHFIGGSMVELKGESAIRFHELISFDNMEDEIASRKRRMEDSKSPDEIVQEERIKLEELNDRMASSKKRFATVKSPDEISRE